MPRLTKNHLLRGKNPVFPAFAYPGGIPTLYYDAENNVLCAKCATESWFDMENPHLRPVSFDLYHEGPPEQCMECYEAIESAYGDPESKEEETL